MTGRTFLLARNSPLRTTLVDEATGQAVYQIDTPRKFVSEVTKIRKLDPATGAPLNWDDAGAGSDDGGDVDKKGAVRVTEGSEPEMDLPETSDEIARIYWKFGWSEKIIFRGRITTQNEFLPATGKLKGSFAFTGSDGIQYRWAMGSMGMNYPKLVTTDGKKTTIAEFHRAHHIIKKRKARLEIQPEGMHMLDYIILTFVFVEHKRRVREESAAISASVSGS